MFDVHVIFLKYFCSDRIFSGDFCESSMVDMIVVNVDVVVMYGMLCSSAVWWMGKEFCIVFLLMVVLMIRLILLFFIWLIICGDLLFCILNTCFVGIFCLIKYFVHLVVVRIWKFSCCSW